MPVLDWLGKDKVINHHLDVPFRFPIKNFPSVSRSSAVNIDDGIVAYDEQIDGCQTIYFPNLDFGGTSAHGLRR